MKAENYRYTKAETLFKKLQEIEDGYLADTEFNTKQFEAIK